MTEDKSLAVRQAQEQLPATISKNQAMYLLKTIWPGAPETDILKAGILCQQYRLNPLMRQVYLIKFDRFAGRGAERRKVGEEWAIVLGIKATRQIAQQAVRRNGCTYGYADGPRKMTEQEEVSIYGEVDPSLFRAIVVIRDNHGNIYRGYGAWPAEMAVYGAEKGNAQANMAFIRAERNALDKLAPGELPDLDVAEDAYVVGDYTKALEAGQKEFDRRVDANIDVLYGNGAVPESAGTEKPAKEPEGSNKPPVQQDTPSPVQPDAISKGEVDMDALKQTLTDIQWTPVDVQRFVFQQFKVTGKTGWDAVVKLNPQQLYDFAQEVERRRLGGRQP